MPQTTGINISFLFLASLCFTFLMFSLLHYFLLCKKCASLHDFFPIKINLSKNYNSFFFFLYNSDSPHIPSKILGLL